MKRKFIWTNFPLSVLIDSGFTKGNIAAKCSTSNSKNLQVRNYINDKPSLTYGNTNCQKSKAAKRHLLRNLLNL
ncbi:hypothetical protein ACO03_21325 (plasmid) [Pantoea ananatis]|nr:hypothetical protein ACO03_21325 [Pantoea ananatis]